MMRCGAAAISTAVPEESTTVSGKTVVVCSVVVAAAVAVAVAAVAAVADAAAVAAGVADAVGCSPPQAAATRARASSGVSSAPSRPHRRPLAGGGRAVRAACAGREARQVQSPVFAGL